MNVGTASPLKAREAVFFDLDGVIIRSHLAILRCINEALKARSLPEFDSAAGASIVGSPIKQVFGEVVSRAGGDFTDVSACISVFRERYEELYMDGTTLQPGMGELLHSVAKQMPIAVATTKPAAVAEKILAALGVRALFSLVAGPEPMAHDETKEATLHRALQELRSLTGKPLEPAMSLMVGDRHHDVTAARANGLPVAGVLWGYGSREELHAADCLVASVADLKELIQPKTL